MATEYSKSIDKQIRKSLAQTWGAGFEHLSLDLQKALYAEQVLNILTSQAMEKYEPAIELARALLVHAPGNEEAS